MIYRKPSSSYIFPDILCLKGDVLINPLQEGEILEYEFHISLSTNIRKEYEGTYYLIPVVQKSVWKEASDYTKAYEQFIIECYKIVLLYKLPDPYVDHWGNQVVVEDKSNLPEDIRIRQVYLPHLK
jgi:hypothetical protein